MKTLAIAACSNPQAEDQRQENERLCEILLQSGCNLRKSPWIYEASNGGYATGKQRAEALMSLFRDPDVAEIYDISGGDMANALLPWLDFEEIQKSRAVFWGYSDLTVILNAIYAKTGKPGVLYSVKNLVRGNHQQLQQQRFFNREDLFSPEITMIQGKRMEGILVGGNIRCLLKLAGTPYFPDVTDKILLLEARSGRVPQMITYLSQLKAMGVFEKIRGILLGTFTQMEKENCMPPMTALVKTFVGDRMPIGKTKEIGHGSDSKAIWIGKKLNIES